MTTYQKSSGTLKSYSLTHFGVFEAARCTETLIESVVHVSRGC